jgi:PAS domain S-box-containing protein
VPAHATGPACGQSNASDRLRLPAVQPASPADAARVQITVSRMLPMSGTGSHRFEAEHVSAILDLLLRETTSFAVLVCDPQGIIRGWNHGAHHILGYSADEALGRSTSIIFTPDDVERGLHQHELRIAREVGVAEDDRWQLRKDGSRLWCTGAMLPMRDGAGEISGFLKIFRDASHLRSRMGYLENALGECARIQSGNTVFLASIAHELRNPLAPLKTALHILQQMETATDGSRQALKIMDRQLAFLERLVEDLVDLTRIGVGKMGLSYARVQLQQLVRDAVDARSPAAPADGVSVRLVMPPLPIEVEVDPERMNQVIANLVNNAVKFSAPSGYVWVTVTADRDHFLLHVKDTGRGIGPELMPRIFDVFTQAGGADDHRGAGLGIGLAVVKEIVDLHLGTIEVRSEGDGKGSEFSVRIPLQRSIAAEARDPDGKD